MQLQKLKQKEKFSMEFLEMNGIKKRKTDKLAVKEYVIEAAAKAFMKKGIRTVRMDDIATGMSISKRTLYELFSDKEELLLNVMKFHRGEMKEYMGEITSKADNVLEVILRFYQKSVQDFQNTNRKFFEDMEKYPKVVAYIAESRKENIDTAMEFYEKGVRQGIFRDDVNYEIVQAMMSEQMDMLIRSEVCRSYSLAEIYETIVFMHMRGISTEKGLRIVDDFLLSLKENEHSKNN